MKFAFILLTCSLCAWAKPHRATPAEKALILNRRGVVVNVRTGPTVVIKPTHHVPTRVRPQGRVIVK